MDHAPKSYKNPYKLSGISTALRVSLLCCHIYLLFQYVAFLFISFLGYAISTKVHIYDYI